MSEQSAWPGNEVRAARTGQALNDFIGGLERGPWSSPAVAAEALAPLRAALVTAWSDPIDSPSAWSSAQRADFRERLAVRVLREVIPGAIRTALLPSPNPALAAAGRCENAVTGELHGAATAALSFGLALRDPLIGGLAEFTLRHLPPTRESTPAPHSPCVYFDNALGNVCRIAVELATEISGRSATTTPGA